MFLRQKCQNYQSIKQNAQLEINEEIRKLQLSGFLMAKVKASIMSAKRQKRNSQKQNKKQKANAQKSG